MKYKVGLKRGNEWKYVIYTDEDQMMEDLFDHVLVYDKVSITKIKEK